MHKRSKSSSTVFPVHARRTFVYRDQHNFYTTRVQEQVKRLEFQTDLLAKIEEAKLNQSLRGNGTQSLEGTGGGMAKGPIEVRLGRKADVGGTGGSGLTSDASSISTSSKGHRRR